MTVARKNASRKNASRKNAPRKNAPRKNAPAPAASTSLDAHDVVEVKAGVFKDTCLQLLDRVHDRDIEVVVTKRGEAVARVVPPGDRAPSAFGFMRGTLFAHEDIVSPDVDAWADLG